MLNQLYVNKHYQPCTNFGILLTLCIAASPLDQPNPFGSEQNYQFPLWLLDFKCITQWIPIIMWEHVRRNFIVIHMELDIESIVTILTFINVYHTSEVQRYKSIISKSWLCSINIQYYSVYIHSFIETNVISIIFIN